MSQTDSLSWLVGSLVKILRTRRGSKEKGALQTSNEYVGTGFVLDYNGLLLTCAHVIEEVGIDKDPDTVRYVVQFPALLERRPSATTLRPAKLIKRVEAGIDLCLLQLEDPLPDGIWPVRLATKQQVRPSGSNRLSTSCRPRRTGGIAGGTGVGAKNSALALPSCTYGPPTIPLGNCSG